VVVLHAGVADRAMWSEFLPSLAAAGFRAVAIDLPGFGEAPVTPGQQAALGGRVGTDGRTVDRQCDAGR
jgi:pimeloyl-ACP methyl ester carboxylesterase